jgi:hypothetical protein
MQKPKKKGSDMNLTPNQTVQNNMIVKRPTHNRGNLSIIPVKNNQMIENNPKFGNSEQIKMEKFTDLNRSGDHSGKRKPLFTLNAC